MHLSQVAGGFSLFTAACAAIGPSANVYIGNAYIQPDGYNRSWVLCVHLDLVYSLGMASTVLAGSAPDMLDFPGPIIRGNKVSILLHLLQILMQRSNVGRYVFSECDRSINRHYNAEEHQYCRFLSFNIKSKLNLSISIGMACSKKEVTGRTVRMVSPSALLLLAILFCISSQFQIKQERSGTIRIIVSPSRLPVTEL